MKRLSILALLVIGTAGSAHALDVQGTLPDDTQWTGAINLIGDVTIPMGKTLTIQPGAVVTASGTDGLFAGLETGAVELIVEGTLIVNGQNGQRVTLTGAGASWYGIRVAATGSANVQYADITKAHHGVWLGATSTVNATTVTGYPNQNSSCLRVSGATNASMVTNSTFAKCNSFAISVDAGTPTFTNNVVYDAFEGIGISGGSPTFDHNTVEKTTYYSIYLSSTWGTATITNNILSGYSSSGYAIYENGSGTVVADYNNYWSNSIEGATTGTISDGGHNISANPLYVNAAVATGLRITSNSPSREAGTTGSDQGALPYTSDATATLMGSLFTSTALTGTQTVTGDLTVPVGVTLTIAAGATLNFAQVDQMWAGKSRGATELAVLGTLVVDGKDGQRVTLTGAGSTWHGVRIALGGTASIRGADLTEAINGIRLEATSTVSNSTVTGFPNQNASCLSVNGASNASTITGSLFSKCNSFAIQVESGTPSFSNNRVFDAFEGIGISGGSPTFDHNTVHKTTYYSVYLSSTWGTATLTNNIFSGFSSSGYGIYENGNGTVVSDYNNLWSYNIEGATTGTISNGTHNTSANPLFVNEVTGDGLRLTSNSPSRKAGSGGSDQGALPYTTDATTGLVGTLWTDTALSGVNAVTGDLTVPSGVTLTLAEGAQLSFAQSDTMWAGLSRGSSELIVQGTLVVNGSSGQRVVLTGTGSTWHGVRVLAGGTAVINNADVTEAQHGVHFASTSTMTSSSVTGYANQNASCMRVSGAGNTSTISSSNFTKCNSFAIQVDDGTPTFSRNVVYDAFEGVGISGGSPTFDNNTIYKTTYYGFYLSSTWGTATLTDNIIAGYSSSGYGIYENGNGTVISDYNNIWSEGITGGGTTGTIASGTHNIAANPLFVNNASDFHLQSTSPCRNKDSSGGDIGAYSFAVGALDHVVVQPGSYTVAGGSDVYFSAIGYDAANNVLPGLTFTWSAKPEAGTINGSGVLKTGCAAATVTNAVTATSGGKSGSANLTITAGPVTKLLITPGSGAVAAGGMQTFTAAASDACNNPLGSATVVWSTPTGKGNITSGGVYTAPCTIGSFVGAVQATSGDLSASVDVVVSPGAVASVTLTPASATVPPAGSQQFSASAVDSCGNNTGAAITWTTSVLDATIGGDGLFTAGTESGTFAGGVTASASGKSKSADVSIPSGSVTTIEITPGSATLAQGAMQTFTAVAKDKNDNIVATPITWSVVAMGGTITSGGVFTAGTKAGTFANTVRASAEGVNAHASITVNPGELDHLVVSPSTITIAPGGMTTLLASGFDANENPVAATVTWTMKNAAAGTIGASDGAFVAGAGVGSYPNAIEASAGGKTGTASVTISAGALFSLSLVPPVAAVPAGSSVAFSVVGKDAGGNTIAVTPTWSLVGGGGTINASGVFVAGTTAGVFPNTVRVEANGLATLGSVTVTPGPVVQVEVTPNHPTMQAFDIVQFSATAKDAFGNTVSGVAVEWSALALAGTITPTGRFTAGMTNGDFPQAVSAKIDTAVGHASVLVQGGSDPNPDMAGGGETPDMAGGGGTPGGGNAGCGGCSASGPTDWVAGLLWPLAIFFAIRRRRAAV